MNPKLTRVFVLAWPDLMVTPELLFWLLEAGFRRERIVFTRAGGKDIAAGYNSMVKLALEGPGDEFVFADNDVRPSPKATAPFLLDNPADLVCVKYPTACGDKTWETPDAFHTALWRTRRDVLERIGLPAFRLPMLADGTAATGCTCQWFSTKARALGFTTSHAGEADHTPKCGPADKRPNVLCVASVAEIRDLAGRGTAKR